MTSQEVRQIALTSAVAAVAGGIASAFVAYLISKATTQKEVELAIARGGVLEGTAALGHCCGQCACRK